MLAKSTEGDNRHLLILKFLLTLENVELKLYCGRTFALSCVSPSRVPQNCLVFTSVWKGKNDSFETDAIVGRRKVFYSGVLATRVAIFRWFCLLNRKDW